MRCKSEKNTSALYFIANLYGHCKKHCKIKCEIRINSINTELNEKHFIFSPCIMMFPAPGPVLALMLVTSVSAQLPFCHQEATGCSLLGDNLASYSADTSLAQCREAGL